MHNAMLDDPSGMYKEYSKRKAYQNFDPYSEESQFASLRYEDEIRLRASIVIDVQIQSLQELFAKKNELNFTDRERLQQVETLLNRLSDIKIIDAPVLLKLYNLYRYQLHE